MMAQMILPACDSRQNTWDDEKASMNLLVTNPETLGHMELFVNSFGS
jgi:hypothetical protein